MWTNTLTWLLSTCTGQRHCILFLSSAGCCAWNGQIEAGGLGHETKLCGFAFGICIRILPGVRGRYPSDGEWYPFKHEQADGFDPVEWAATLPYSDGKVGMMGGSYVGATQMLAAIAQPPHLAGIAPNVTASNYHENWAYQGGAFEQWFDQNWTSQLAQNTLQRLIAENTNDL